jgi:hypothetical protein
MKVSDAFKTKLWLDERKAWKIAIEADVNPSVLSRIVCGYEKLRPNDDRVLRIGKILGLAENQCFEG